MTFYDWEIKEAMNVILSIPHAPFIDNIIFLSLI